MTEMTTNRICKNTSRYPRRISANIILLCFLCLLLQHRTSEAFTNCRSWTSFHHSGTSIRNGELSSNKNVPPATIQRIITSSNIYNNNIRKTQTRLATYENGNNNNGGEDPKGGWINMSERTKGLAVLLTVPFAWGTYVPVVRYLYEIQPAVPGFVFSAAYYAVASFTTLSIVAFQGNKKNSNVDDNKQSASDEDDDDESNSVESSKSSPFPIFGGMELGMYLFLGNCLQVVGLKTVPSDRAGFLVQLTTVMVPVTEAVIAGNLLKVPTRTWVSCLLAFCGICVMNLDGIGQGSIGSVMVAFQSFTQGDILILASAVMYTMHVVRLGRYAKETTPIKLAAAKATVETVLSTGLVLGLMAYAGSAATSTGGLLSFAQESGAEISTFFSTITKSFAAGTIPQSAIISAVGATLWTGLVTCAYTIFAQSFGQKRVGPSDANLIYSIQPICTAIFAFLLLGETMGPAGVFGGAFIGAAVYLVTMTGDGMNINDDDSDDNSDSDSAISILEAVKETDIGRARNTTEVLVKR